MAVFADVSAAVFSSSILTAPSVQQRVEIRSVHHNLTVFYCIILGHYRAFQGFYRPQRLSSSDGVAKY